MSRNLFGMSCLTWLGHPSCDVSGVGNYVGTGHRTVLGVVALKTSLEQPFEDVSSIMIGTVVSLRLGDIGH